MIDRTNLRIEEMEEEIRRQNERRYAFYRMLNATDRVLWRLEEMNRDGVKTIPEPLRSEIRETVEELPSPCVDAFRDSDRVQDTLDSIFDMQECLFKWRNPEWAVEEGEDLERVAS
jgi:hypothetical protein